MSVFSKKQEAYKRRTRPGRVWFGFTVLLTTVGVSALGVVYSTHQSRHLLNELHALENERNALQVEWGQLLLEQSSLISQGRVEDIAKAELNMVIPGWEDIVVVKR
jgi:cell division protein FtsL